MYRMVMLAFVFVCTLYGASHSQEERNPFATGSSRGKPALQEAVEPAKKGTSAAAKSGAGLHAERGDYFARIPDRPYRNRHGDAQFFAGWETNWAETAA